MQPINKGYFSCVMQADVPTGERLSDCHRRQALDDGEASMTFVAYEPGGTEPPSDLT
jgi:hypothetical protein